MFCPQCGHQQVSKETRFCSRCGLSLGLVTDLLGNSRDQLQREKRELTNLIRGGFFKRLKERELRLKLLKSEQEHQMLPEESGSASFDVRSIPRMVDPVSVTETTTRELQAIPKPTGEISPKKEAIDRVERGLRGTKPCS